MSSNGAANQIGLKGAAKPPGYAHVFAYDELPPELRACVRDAALDWDTCAILANIQAGASATSIVRYIRDFERAHCKGAPR